MKLGTRSLSSLVQRGTKVTVAVVILAQREIQTVLGWLRCGADGIGVAWGSAALELVEKILLEKKSLENRDWHLPGQRT